MSNIDSSALDYLCERYVSGCIDGEEAIRLRDLVRRDPEIARKLHEHMDMNLLLDEALPELLADEKALSHSRNKQVDYDLPGSSFPNPYASADTTLEALISPRTAPANPVPSTEQIVLPKKSITASTKVPFYKTPAYNLALTALVVILFALGVYSEFGMSGKAGSSEPVFRPLATIRSAIDIQTPENGNNVKLKRGQQLASGKIAFASGTLELRLANDVRLVLEGPVDFQLHSAMHTFCGRGKISATVPPSGKGFEIVTPLTTLVDLGTEFSLLVDAENVEAHTLKGMVELHRLPEGRKNLGQGKACKIDPDGKTKHFAADPATFLDNNTVRAKVTASENIQRERWRNRRTNWKTDPALLLWYDFEGDDREFANRSESSRKLPGSVFLRKAATTEGRWLEKGAVAFRSRNDRVELDIPRELRSLTLLASVRIDSLDRFSNALLMSETYGGGKLFWQIGSGAIRLAVQPPDGAVAVDYSSEKTIRRHHWGAWYVIATVVDAESKTVRHYFDGKLVSALPMRETWPITVGRAQLGNGPVKSGRSADCSFRGAIDEFMLFDRALDDEDIRTLSVME